MKDKNINDNLLANISEQGISIISSALITVGIHKDTAKKYRDNFNSEYSVSGGFVKHDGKVILTHFETKVVLTEEEATAVIEAINTAEKEIW